MQPGEAREGLLQILESNRGTISVLRKGIDHLGCKFDYYFPPSIGLMRVKEALEANTWCRYATKFSQKMEINRPVH